MNAPNQDDIAEPAKASSIKSRRHSHVPPWIEERRLREARIREAAEVLNLPAPLIPGTQRHARSLDPAIHRLRRRLMENRDEPIPF